MPKKKCEQKSFEYHCIDPIVYQNDVVGINFLHILTSCHQFILRAFEPDAIDVQIEHLIFLVIWAAINIIGSNWFLYFQVFGTTSKCLTYYLLCCIVLYWSFVLYTVPVISFLLFTPIFKAKIPIFQTNKTCKSIFCKIL